MAPPPISERDLAVLVVSTAVTFLAYGVCGRRWNPLRFPLGTKPMPARVQEPGDLSAALR